MPVGERGAEPTIFPFTGTSMGCKPGTAVSETDVDLFRSFVLFADDA